ncbi:uncharacterized protein LOC111336443 [Stylophora pistillata]|uniref:uncharacterized protein LOC111336443 n=1 Tax=Stylophora pistillata TaxID=50429 RepID=UPI000C042F63|nr:uncharacterized protein LOC111336443 [Stylophora pistillata]
MEQQCIIPVDAHSAHEIGLTGLSINLPRVGMDWELAIREYTTALKTSIMDQTEFQPKLLASHTISNAKTDEIFTNLLIQHGRKPLPRNDETYSRSEDLEYFGKVSGTPVKHWVLYKEPC